MCKFALDKDPVNYQLTVHISQLSEHYMLSYDMLESMVEDLDIGYIRHPAKVHLNNLAMHFGDRALLYFFAICKKGRAA